MTVAGHGPERYAVGLYRVSTAEQGHSGLELKAQQASVRAYVAAQGWTLVTEYSDVASGKDGRPGFRAARLECVVERAQAHMSGRKKWLTSKGVRSCK